MHFIFMRMLGGSYRRLRIEVSVAVSVDVGRIEVSVALPDVKRGTDSDLCCTVLG